MSKTIPIFFIVLFFRFSLLANCPNSKDIWLAYQKTIKAKNPQKQLLGLSQICLKCNIQDSTYALILEKLAETYAEENNYNKAITLINQTIVLNKSSRKEIRPWYLEGNYFCLGKYYNQQGENQKSTNAFDQSIEIANRFPNNATYLSKSYSQKARILTKVGDYEKAIVQANIGINYALLRGDRMGLGLCYSEKAKTLNSLGNSTSADSLAYKAIDVLQGTNQESNSNLGYCYYLLAQNSKSKQNYLKAIDLYVKAQQYFLLSNVNDMFYKTFISIGMAHYYLKNYDQALNNFNKSLNIRSEQYIKVNIYDDIASTYWLKKDYPRAFFYFQKALSAGPIGFEESSGFDNPSVNSLKKADYKQFYLTTLKDKADTWLEYAQSTKSPIHLQVALNTYLTADKLIDIMRFEHTGTSSKLYWRSKTHSIYVQAIETCFLLKDYEKAFYFFEKSKAVLLNDQLNGLSANQQLSANDLAQEKGFQQTISELNKKIGLENENSKNYATLQNQLLDQQEKRDQFVKTLETKNPTYFKYKYDTTMVSLDKVKKYLAKDQTILEYFMGDDAIYALIISPDKTDLQKIPLLEYSKNAKQFLSYCSDNQKINQNFRDFLLVSNQIYQQIFRYLNIPKGRLIITQDGYFLPFEALSKSSKRAEYLLNDYAISYTYSVQFLLKNLGENSFSFSHKFMGMSPVNFSKNLNQTSLSGSDISLSEVASNFIFGKKFSEKEATKNAFLNNAKDYKIVHLYTHAQADSTDQEPMIYFADSVLKLSDLNALERFKTQLLVLSACKTAVGKNAKGEGILSLSRGFAALGIPTTLTTLWSVENQSTYTLNELFYRYLSEGYPKDISLQKAKIEFLQSQSGEKQLPTFWAAAVLVGDAEAVSLSDSWGYLGIIVMLGLLGFWWYRKLTADGVFNRRQGYGQRL
jgi:CHAT domain-containing protein/tetratricopeptide (TPR) repeat protein